MQRRQIILDGENFDDEEGFYREAARVLTAGLDWPAGHSLDAFCDLLGGGFGVHAPGEPLAILWRHAAKSRRDLGYPATAAHWQRALGRCHPANREAIRAKAEAALQGVGPTLFEDITAIICDAHGHDCTLTLED